MIRDAECSWSRTSPVFACRPERTGDLSLWGKGFIRRGELTPGRARLQIFSPPDAEKYFWTDRVMLDPAQPLPPAAPPLVDPNELKTWVLFENAGLLVIDKPGWLVVHPSKNGPWSSLAGAVREGFGLEAIRFIYRLDRETSGVIILARDEGTGSRLQKAMGKRRIGKAYVTLLEGELSGPVTVDQP
ncbi:MAG TPA: pseudouridine synthase, partial [Candidatus Didemnitutus sp.]|nr:pseudouridine synthase [Candidatus Didemnitutus sp.]